MIKLKNETIYDQMFSNSLSRIMNSNDLELKVGYDLTKIAKKCKNQFIDEVEGFRKKLVEKYADKDDEGKVIYIDIKGPIPGNKRPQITDENKAKFEEDFKELMKIEFEIPVNPVLLSKLAPAKPSPNEIMALEPILEVDIDKPKLEVAK